MLIVVDRRGDFSRPVDSYAQTPKTEIDRPMSGATNFINKGIEHIRQAVQADEVGNKEEAFRLYKIGIEYFTTAIKYERIAKRKETLRARTLQYVARAETLKEELYDAAPRSSPSNSLSADNRRAKAHNTIGDDQAEDDQRRNALESLALASGSDTPPVYWRDIAGLDTAKQMLRESVILPMRLPHLFGSGEGKRKPWNAILLYGPPGTGKTHLARAVATEARCTFYTVSASMLMSKWLGESEKAVRDLFVIAKQNAPSVIFIDEIDSLCGQRSSENNGGQESEASRRVKNEFLTQTNAMPGVVLLGATNLPWALDTAFRRRFKKRIYIPLPSSEARIELFKIHLQNKDHSVAAEQLNDLANQTDGYSGSDIATLVDEAHMRPVRLLETASYFFKTNTGHWVPCDDEAVPGAVQMIWENIEDYTQIQLPPTSLEHLQDACRQTKPTVSLNDLKQYEAWTQEFGQDGT